ncbi:hypothetical protein EDB83DRAFT_347912 [Lactarius deliciosus]|nr:hypothetical protein EDB83DRAFT_347912 [Lactarius deliciosus]
MRLGRTMTLSTRAQYHSQSLNSIRNGYPVAQSSMLRTPPALRIHFAESLAPLCNRLFYPVANRCLMAHGSHGFHIRRNWKHRPYSWLSCCPNDLPVYLLLVQSHLRKACLWACMEEGTDEGDGVVGDEALVRRRRRRQRYPTPLLYNCCPHYCAHLLSQSTSLRAQAPLGTAGHATCPATVGLHGSPVVRTSFTAVYLQVWSYTNSLPPLFLHLCILAS